MAPSDHRVERMLSLSPSLLSLSLLVETVTYPPRRVQAPEPRAEQLGVKGNHFLDEERVSLFRLFLLPSEARLDDDDKF